MLTSCILVCLYIFLKKAMAKQDDSVSIDNKDSHNSCYNYSIVFKDKIIKFIQQMKMETFTPIIGFLRYCIKTSLTILVNNCLF